MHHGIFSCAGDAPLSEVAQMMSKHRIHAVAVTERVGARPAGIVSDLDVASALASGAEPTALQVAATEPLTVSADDPLHRAAQMMSEHGVSHLVVVDASDGHPVGIMSTLDLATVYAGAADR